MITTYNLLVAENTDNERYSFPLECGDESIPGI